MPAPAGRFELDAGRESTDEEREAMRRECLITRAAADCASRLRPRSRQRAARPRVPLPTLIAPAIVLSSAPEPCITAAK